MMRHIAQKSTMRMSPRADTASMWLILNIFIPHLMFSCSQEVFEVLSGEVCLFQAHKPMLLKKPLVTIITRKRHPQRFGRYQQPSKRHLDIQGICMRYRLREDWRRQPYKESPQSCGRCSGKAFKARSFQVVFDGCLNRSLMRLEQKKMNTSAHSSIIKNNNRS